MRIDELKKDLQKQYEIIKQIPQSQNSSTNGRKTLTGIGPYMSSIRYLSEKYGEAFPTIQIMQNRYKTLFLWSQTSIVAEANEIQSYIHLFENLKKELEQSLSLLEIASPTPIAGYYLKIKLPECTTSSQVQRFFTDINFILSQTDKCYGTKNGDFELYDFQHGSKWTDFVVKNKETLEAFLLILEISVAVLNLTVSYRDVIEFLSPFDTEHSKKVIIELEDKKREIIRTETEKIIEEKRQDIKNSDNEQVIINTTTKIIEKTTIILESGGTFQIEIVEDLSNTDNSTTCIDATIREKIESSNKEQLKITENLHSFSSYPQLSLPEPEEKFTDETNNK